MRLRRLKLPLLALLPVLTLLASLIAPPSVSAQDEAEPVTITVWLQQDDRRAAVDEDLIAQFMADNPEIEVVLKTYSPMNYDAVLRTALAAGIGPDLFSQWTGEIGQYYAEGRLAPFDPEAAGLEATSDLETLYAPAPSLLAGGAFGGRLFAFPLDVSGYACYTNDALWRDAGLDPARDFPDTWEAMRDVAEQLTVRDAQGAITQRGFDFNWSAPLFMWLQFEPMVRQLGSALVDEQTFTVTIDTPEAARVMAYWTDWANEWNLGGPDFEDTRVSFLKGLLATECTFGIGGAAQIEAAGIDWSVHPVPTWADAINENRGAVFANLLMVNAASPPLARAAAWKLAWFLLDHPDRYYAEAGMFQPRAAFIDSDAFQDDPVLPFFLEQMATSFYPARVPAWMQIAEALAQGRTRVIVGDESVETMLRVVQAEVADLVARARLAAEG